jgi:hypothetical protein
VDLSVSIVSWNTRDLLQRCLESVYGTIAGLEFEVLVVDNGSTDGSPEMVRCEYPRATLLANDANVGFARANNQAIRASSGRHVLLLNSDAVLLGHAAELMVRFLDAHPEVGAVGGMLLNPDGSFQSSYADFPELLGETLLLTGLSRWLLPATYPSYPEARSRETRPVDWVGGALLAARRQTLDDVGLLDEGYFMYSEEVDWCYRMKERGWAIYYLPEVRAIHWLGASYGRVPARRRAQLYHSKCRFLRKHRGWLQAAAYGLLVRAVSAVKLLAWLPRELSLDPASRDRARQQVASYRFLLANF